MRCLSVRKFVHLVDSVNEWMGHALRWVIMLAICFTCLEVFQRYVFNHPTMWGFEVPIHLGAAFYTLAFGFVLLHKGHVRVDVFYAKYSERGRAIVDVVCFFVLFLPVIGILAYTSGDWMIHAWVIGEKSVITYWYPAIAPMRTAIFVGMTLFLLQGVAQLVRDMHFLVRGEHID